MHLCGSYKVNEHAQLVNNDVIQQNFYGSPAEEEQEEEDCLEEIGKMFVEKYFILILISLLNVRNA